MVSFPVSVRCGTISNTKSLFSSETGVTPGKKKLKKSLF
jgi:hypothetical protein